MKRWVSAVLALVILLSVLPVAGASGFSDVAAGSWYYDAVQYAVDNGLMNGVGSGRFEPDTRMSRAMLVTVLWRYAGSPEEGQNAFADVASGQWYEKAVAWAAENGVVTGVGDGKFDPDGNVTREQLSAVLYRYSNSLGMDTSGQEALSGFPDARKVSTWAAEAISWAVAERLITGNEINGRVYLDPQGHATRAQVATILMRYIESYCKGICLHPQWERWGASEPDCDTDGYTGEVYCLDCCQILEEGSVIPALGHSYENGKCTRCGESQVAEKLTVAGKTYSLGMSEAELLALAGEPGEKLPALKGFVWYAYGIQTYTDFFMAGVYEGKVVSLCATGVGFEYRGEKMGGSLPSVSADNHSVNLRTDQNDGDIFLAVLLTQESYRYSPDRSDAALAGESKMNFHLTNAFRVYHGKNILQWCDKAATAVRLHCEDMAEQNYFDHYSLDGRSPGDRMRQQGIPCGGWCENLCAGYATGLDAYCAWVNSESHRRGMLSFAEYLGVGFAYREDTPYRYYAGQNYYS